MNVTPKIAIDYRELKREIDKRGMTAVAKDLKTLWYKTKDAVNYKWDNCEIKVSNIFGECFAVQFHVENGEGSVSMWNENGQVSLDSYKIRNDKFLDYARMVEIMENWTRGIVPCSKCGRPFKYHERENRTMFAGVFCEECWENGMRKEAGSWTND